MSRPCEPHRQVLLAYGAGELDPLTSARTEAHLAHCGACKKLARELQESLAAAKDPPLDTTSLDALNRVVLTQHKTPPDTFRLFLAAAAAIFLVTWWQWPNSAEIIRRAPTPHLTVVQSADWEGGISAPNLQLTQMKLRQGWAVLAFKGGEGRHLTVTTPHATVEVIGTRFFVVAEKARSVVGVVSGKVKVIGPEGEKYLLAGQTWATDAQGEVPVPAEVPAAAYVFDAVFPPEPPVPVETPEVSVAPIPPPIPPPIPVPALKIQGENKPGALSAQEKFALAQKKELAGDFEGAARIWRRLSADHQAGIWRDWARLEYGRSLLARGDPKSAQPLVENLLKRAPEPILGEARLLECQLAQAQGPCLAKRCLSLLVPPLVSAEVYGEAQQLLVRWGLRDRACSP